MQTFAFEGAPSAQVLPRSEQVGVCQQARLRKAQRHYLETITLLNVTSIRRRRQRIWHRWYYENDWATAYERWSWHQCKSKIVSIFTACYYWIVGYLRWENCYL